MLVILCITRNKLRSFFLFFLFFLLYSSFNGVLSAILFTSMYPSFETIMLFLYLRIFIVVGASSGTYVQSMFWDASSKQLVVVLNCLLGPIVGYVNPINAV